jgi:hypothetical protein
MNRLILYLVAGLGAVECWWFGEAYDDLDS